MNIEENRIYYWIHINHNIITSNQQCYYCEDEFINESDHHSLRRTRDHIIPRAKGGWLVSTNRVFCCDTCNRLKGVKTPQEFLEYLIELNEKHFKNGNDKRINTQIKNVQILINYIQSDDFKYEPSKKDVENRKRQIEAAVNNKLKKLNGNRNII